MSEMTVDQLLIAADAVEQATKAGLSFNAARISECVMAGLPAECEFASAEGLDATFRICGDVLEVKRDGKVIKTASVEAVGKNRLLVQWAIAQSLVHNRMGA